MCKFANDRGNTLLSTITSFVSGTDLQTDIDIASLCDHWLSASSTSQTLPIGNISAWKQLQENDTSINQAAKYLKAGQNPPKSNKSTELKEIRDYVSKCKINRFFIANNFLNLQIMSA